MGSNSLGLFTNFALSARRVQNRSEEMSCRELRGAPTQQLRPRRTLSLCAKNPPLAPHAPPPCSMPTIVAPSAAGIMPFYADYSGPAMSESQAAFIDHKQPKRAAVSCSHSHSAILPVHTAQFLPITGGVLPRIRRAAAGDGAGGAADGARRHARRDRGALGARLRAAGQARLGGRGGADAPRGAARRGELNEPGVLLFAVLCRSCASACRGAKRACVSSLSELVMNYINNTARRRV